MVVWNKDTLSVDRSGVDQGGVQWCQSRWCSVVSNNMSYYYMCGLRWCLVSTSRGCTMYEHYVTNESQLQDTNS